jgi:hypothetical protein
MDDDNAVFQRRCEQDMVASPDTVLPPRRSWDNDARLTRNGEQAIGGGEDNNRAERDDNFDRVPGLPAEGTDDIAVRDSSGCVYTPNAVQQRGVVR